MNFCLGELILKLLAPIGDWHQNLSEMTAGDGAEGRRGVLHSHVHRLVEYYFSSALI